MCESRERSVSRQPVWLSCNRCISPQLETAQRSNKNRAERSNGGRGTDSTTVVGKTANHATGVRDPPHGHGARRPVTKSKNEIRVTRRFSFHSRFTITGSRSPRSLTYGALRVASGFSLFTLKPYVIVPHAHRTTDLLIETREREQGQGAQGGACDMEINDHMPPPPPHALRHR